tara:strand:+ start:528 stop:707 length:180 start_codon:yes stop_codon:yes gene_type:complete
MTTKKEYEEAQNIVWDYEEQLKSNVVLDYVIKCLCNHPVEDRFPRELINKECDDCAGAL